MDKIKNTPFQQHPQLFMSDKFKVMGMRGEGEIIRWLPKAEIIEYQTETHSYSHLLHIDNAKLIARPISDLTDEEVEEIAPDNIGILYTLEDYKTILTAKAESDDLVFSDVRKLLQFGTYPGPQSHFESGHVIDATGGTG